MVQAWYISSEFDDQQDYDIRHDMKGSNPQNVNIEEIAILGCDYWKLDGQEQNLQLEDICQQRSYTSRDQVKIGEAFTPNYQQLLIKFRTEHIHEDEEIRYILDGQGYFDIRDANDKWIRVLVEKGDMIVLPEGIYHRFTPDITNYVHAMRLFKDEPKWTPFNRPQEDNPSRINYLKLFLKQ